MKRFAIYVFIFSLVSITGADGSQTLNELRENGYEIEKVEESISLDELAIKYYRKVEDQSHLDLDSFKELFKKWNPHLKEKTDLKGEYVYTDSPFSPYISYEYAPNLSPFRENISEEGKEDFYQAFMGKKDKNQGRTPASQSHHRSFIGFMHFTMSQGEFSENINSSVLTNNQNSPLTLGVGGVYLFDKFSNYSLSGSFYISKLTVSDVEDPNNNLNNTNVDIPDEVGMNLYVQRNTERFVSNVYGGVDYEKFSTLNFEDILANGQRNLTHNQEQMIFATVGVSFNKKVILPTAFKLSTSYVLNSKTNLSGYKYMLYANQKLTNRFWYHLLYKKHTLVSSVSNREVGISRFGIGVGMGF